MTIDPKRFAAESCIGYIQHFCCVEFPKDECVRCGQTRYLHGTKLVCPNCRRPAYNPVDLGVFGKCVHEFHNQK